MQHLVKLEEFYDSLQEINLINSDVDAKRDTLKKEVYSFKEDIQNKQIDKSLFKQNEDMAKLLEATINLIKKSSAHWVDTFEEMIEKEKFRSDLKNYFIVIIFGKVKAGKSSLGNFIAKHKLENQKVEFFKYDEAGKKQNIKKLKELDDDEFDTNNLECTVDIQGFKLAGMAWIDTPGLGSMVKENGDLAKEYIQSADYVIYPTSSDAAFDMSEQNQLKELFEQNKPVTICITKSDTPEEDECECGSEDGCENCDEGLVSVLKNKSLENRNAQEEHVQNEIKNILTEDQELLLGEIYSLSTHIANISLETNDRESFENSNIPKFYELLTNVVKEKATKLKETTPYSGLKSLIDNDILGNGKIENESSIKNIKKSLDDLDENISESIQRFQILQENVNNDLASEIENVIALHYSEINKDNFKELVQTIDSELNVQVSEVIQKNIQELFENFDKNLKSLTTSLDSTDFDIEDTFKEITYSTAKRNKQIGMGIFASVATIVVGVVLAPATGGVSLAATAAFAASATATIGVTAATMVGSTTAISASSYVGGKIGEATGSTEIEKIKVGDNKEEVIQKFKSIRLEHYENYAKDVYKMLQDTFFKPLQSTLNEVNRSLVGFETNIQKII